MHTSGWPLQVVACRLTEAAATCATDEEKNRDSATCARCFGEKCIKDYESIGHR